jgi:hypothetical protein
MTGDHFFLFLNASVVWFVVAALLMKLCRLKSLVLVLFIAPYVIGSTFRHVAGMPQLIGFYGLSMLYGSLGIIGGMLYMEYARIKQQFQKASKLAFLARGAIALSSLYLLSFFAQKILLSIPMMQLALDWMEGGDQARGLLSHADMNGAMMAGAGIATGLILLGVQRYMTSKASQPPSNTSNQLEHQ